jgi:hypothetical protein
VIARRGCQRPLRVGGTGGNHVQGGPHVAEGYSTTPRRPLEYAYVGDREHGTVVIVPSGRGKSRAGGIRTSRVTRRLGLLDDLIEARRFVDRSRADEILVEANRWLRRHPFDLRVAQARDRLRALHPVDPDDTK